VGNRLSSHLSGEYVYDNLNRLLEDDTYTYTYDNNGNLTSKVDKVSSVTTTYQYDGENRLIQVATPTDIVLYQYDGFGRRISKTINGVVTKYVYDREDILFELDENNQIKARYTHGPGIPALPAGRDEPISVDRDTDGNGTLETTYYYHYDGLGSVTAITDSAGTVVQTYVYDAFGKIVQQTGSIENSSAYTGREWDAEAGLYFYRARYYDPSIGRFINADPIGFSGGDVNFYVYVQNNPVNFADPYGLITLGGIVRSLNIVKAIELGRQAGEDTRKGDPCAHQKAAWDFGRYVGDQDAAFASRFLLEYFIQYPWYSFVNNISQFTTGEATHYQPNSLYRNAPGGAIDAWEDINNTVKGAKGIPLDDCDCGK
jgi:RHS repeat-associated protein